MKIEIEIPENQISENPQYTIKYDGDENLRMAYLAHVFLTEAAKFTGVSKRQFILDMAVNLCD